MTGVPEKVCTRTSIRCSSKSRRSTAFGSHSGSGTPTICTNECSDGVAGSSPKTSKRGPRLDGELVTPRAHGVPVVLGLELDRGRDGEPSRRIPRPLPAAARGNRALLLPVPADDGGLEQLLPLRPRIQEARALRRTQPLVAV